MASLKAKVNNLDVDKLKTAPADISKLSNIVNNDVFKDTVYNQLARKANVIDATIPKTTGLVTKTQYDSDKQGHKKKIEDVEEKIPNTSGLFKKTESNTNIAKI